MAPGVVDGGDDPGHVVAIVKWFSLASRGGNLRWLGANGLYGGVSLLFPLLLQLEVTGDDRRVPSGRYMWLREIIERGHYVDIDKKRCFDLRGVFQTVAGLLYRPNCRSTRTRTRYLLRRCSPRGCC